MRKRYCLRGHDRLEVGIDKNRRCRECRREGQRAYQAERRKDASFRMYKLNWQAMNRLRTRIPRVRREIAALERELALLLRGGSDEGKDGD